ncbi:MAG: sporulation transcription factor Spo0A [Firmicutes bacterium]|nr:sporulation transcription factor Spo0A [Bacillota bacterium]MCL2771333.1 sporulation transcription factor Spo0A [Bacillota bacterium]
MKLKCLVAEEIKFIGEMKEQIEACESFEIIKVTNNGKTVLEEVRETKADILILDIILSGIDGLEVLNQMRSSGQLEKTKVVIVSSISGDDFIDKVLALGATAFLSKPFSEKLLIEKLHEVKNGENSVIVRTIDGFVSLIPTESKFLNEINHEVLLSNLHAAKPKAKRPFKELEEKITKIFISVGIPPHIKGYQFLREAIKISVENPEIINSITKHLYPNIATRFSTSSSKVERAIRHAIEVAYNRGKIENINNIFGMRIYGSNDKPTNGEFIALLADRMILDGFN